MNNFLGKVSNSLYIIWTIAWKDVVDAIRSRLFLSVTLGSIIMLSLPRLMPLMFEQPAFPVVIYDPNSSQIVSALETNPRISVTRVASLEELEGIISSLGIGFGPELGIALPVDFDQRIEDGGKPTVESYVVWANRSKAAELEAEFETLISQVSDQPVQIRFNDHILYPLDDSLLSGILIIGGVVMMLVIGITLVPYLMFEEKQTKTIEALLVSPASVSQVVIGKALAGFFYILVAAGILLALYLVNVVHWGVMVAFFIACGLFSIALGLVFGSFFENPQEVSGWMGALLLLLIGAMLVDLMRLDLPPLVYDLLPWVPTVAQEDIFRMALMESFSSAQLWTDLGMVAIISALLYALVVWKVRRSDR